MFFFILTCYNLYDIFYVLQKGVCKKMLLTQRNRVIEYAKFGTIQLLYMGVAILMIPVWSLGHSLALENKFTVLIISAILITVLNPVPVFYIGTYIKLFLKPKEFKNVLTMGSHIADNLYSDQEFCFSSARVILPLVLVLFLPNLIPVILIAVLLFSLAVYNYERTREINHLLKQSPHIRLELFLTFNEYLKISQLLAKDSEYSKFMSRIDFMKGEGIDGLPLHIRITQLSIDFLKDNKSIKAVRKEFNEYKQLLKAQHKVDSQERRRKETLDAQLEYQKLKNVDAIIKDLD